MTDSFYERVLKGFGKNFIKRWIINLSFVQYAITGKYQDGVHDGGAQAFPLAQKDILETMADDLDKKAEELAKQKLNDILSPIDLHKLVTLNKAAGLVYIGGVKAEEGRLSNLKAEAEFVLNSEVWQLIKETPKSLAERAMFVSGEGLDDMKKGRSILYTLSTQQNILDTFKSFTPRVVPKDKL